MKLIKNCFQLNTCGDSRDNAFDLDTKASQ